MHEIEEKILIEAPLEKVWEHIKRVDRWWPGAAGKGGEEMKKGAKIELLDEVTGGGEAIGEISDFLDMRKVAWEARDAAYRFWGLSAKVEEGVTWTINPVADGTELVARVWAKFPDTLMGRLAEWHFASMAKGGDKIRARSSLALKHVKQHLET